MQTDKYIVVTIRHGLHEDGREIIGLLRMMNWEGCGSSLGLLQSTISINVLFQYFHRATPGYLWKHKLKSYLIEK
jgi:hypothetical protein